MLTLRPCLPLPTTPLNRPLSFSTSLTTTNPSFFPNLSSLTLCPHTRPTTLIRMGGGPRTYPGGVSKWQWKRMQANKAKQLLKARLSRERQIYELRKRAELKAAVSDLERPWDVVHKAAPKTSTLFSVSADEQLKVLADRFQKPGGFDMWSDKDGPQLFVTPDDGFPSARFFPKGVVHSIKPYGRIDQRDVRDLDKGGSSDFEGSKSEERRGSNARKYGTRRRIGSGDENGGKLVESDVKESGGLSSKLLNAGDGRSDRSLGKNRSVGDSRMDRKKGRSGSGNGEKLLDSRKGGHGSERVDMSSRNRREGGKWSSRGKNSGTSRLLDSEDIYDMSLEGDGSYGFRGSDRDGKMGSKSSSGR